MNVYVYLCLCVSVYVCKKVYSYYTWDMRKWSKTQEHIFPTYYFSVNIFKQSAWTLTMIVAVEEWLLKHNGLWAWCFIQAPAVYRLSKCFPFSIFLFCLFMSFPSNILQLLFMPTTSLLKSCYAMKLLCFCRSPPWIPALSKGSAGLCQAADRTVTRRYYRGKMIAIWFHKFVAEQLASISQPHPR